MRAVFVPLARFLPSRLVSGRIIPWATLTLATFGAGWTLFQYADGVGAQRSQTTLAIHRQFLDTFPDGAQSITGKPQLRLLEDVFRLRCETYRTAIANGDMPQSSDLPQCEKVSISDRVVLDDIGADAPQSVRKKIREASGVTKVDDPAAARRMMTYLRSLQVCVERNLCHHEITTELFAGDIVAFLNVSCDLGMIDAEYDRQARLLAGFVRGLLPDETIPWNTDPDRIDLFRCDFLRAKTT